MLEPGRFVIKLCSVSTTLLLTLIWGRHLSLKHLHAMRCNSGRWRCTHVKELSSCWGFLTWWLTICKIFFYRFVLIDQRNYCEYNFNVFFLYGNEFLFFCYILCFSISKSPNCALFSMYRDADFCSITAPCFHVKCTVESFYWS